MSIDRSHSQMGQSVGAKIRAARQAKKYTQSKLARPDFSVSYISAIERGQIHPSLRALEILASRLDLNMADLMPGRYGGKEATGTEGAWDNHNEEGELLLLEARVALYQGQAERA